MERRHPRSQGPEGAAGEGGSAKTLDRPALQRALAALRDGRADALLVPKLDRLTRRVVDLGHLIEGYLAEGRWALVSVADQIDTRTAAGRMTLFILMSVAQWEREAIGERTADALAHLRAEGVPLGRPALGWRHTPATDPATGRRVLGEVEGELATVARIRALRAEGRSYAAIARQLAAEGHPSDSPEPGEAHSEVRTAWTASAGPTRRLHGVPLSPPAYPSLSRTPTPPAPTPSGEALCARLQWMSEAALEQEIAHLKAEAGCGRVVVCCRRRMRRWGRAAGLTQGTCAKGMLRAEVPAVTVALTPCTSCFRHVQSSCEQCPFCGAVRTPTVLTLRVVAGRLSRAAIFALGSAAALADCYAGDDPPYGSPPVPWVDAGSQDAGVDAAVDATASETCTLGDDAGGDCR